MDNLKGSFEDVADWCEAHLEARRGREIGMIFGAMIRAYGRLATLPSRLSGEERAKMERQLDARAEDILRELSVRFVVDYGWVENKKSFVDPGSVRTNMIYDGGQRPQIEEEEASMNEPRFEILQEDMGGWVRVFLGRGEPTGEVAKFLSHGLADWIRRRPHLRIRFVVPISRDGDTAELHAWYDQVLFPDTSTMANPEADG